MGKIPGARRDKKEKKEEKQGVKQRKGKEIRANCKIGPMKILFIYGT